MLYWIFPGIRPSIVEPSGGEVYDLLEESYHWFPFSFKNFDQIMLRAPDVSIWQVSSVDLIV